MAKHEFDAGILASLRPRAGEGGLMAVPLDQITPDPDQPRKSFDQAKLEALAETVRLKGILQPLALRRGQETGRWIIVHGERRWRAAALAGLKTVPAFDVKREGEGDTAAQVIENRHRMDLTNSEIASAISVLSRDTKDDQIAIIVDLPKQQLKHYRALLRLPEALQPWTNRLDARVIYELFLAWEKADGKGRGVIEDRLEHLGPGNLSMADARRLIASLAQDGLENEKVAVPGDSVIRRANSREENQRLRETIDRLVLLLRSAAEIIRASNMHEADRLMREADSVQAHTGEGQGALPD